MTTKEETLEEKIDTKISYNIFVPTITLVLFLLWMVYGIGQTTQTAVNNNIINDAAVTVGLNELLSANHLPLIGK